MRSFHAGGAALALAALCLTVPWSAGSAHGQDAGAPALFPIPLAGAYPVSQVAAGDSSWQPTEPSPSDLPSPIPTDNSPQQSPAPADEYQAAMKGGWESCTGSISSSCDAAGCCPSKYVYANGLVMTRIQSGGFVASTDAGGDPALSFNSSEFGNLWHGGFELGTGWCFGCNGNRGVEVVYWGLYAGPATVTAEGTLDSLIDLGDIDYSGGDGNAIFDGAATHRLIFDHGLHSVEVNLLGNYGGPLGCGRVGHCGTGCGERWGFGWLAGFRYIHYTEDWLFSADVDDNVFDDDADQLNYEVDLQNNLYGFQLGVGFDYCITPAFQAYVIGKAGIFGNDIAMQQRLYGSGGPATLNSGPLSGSQYDIAASDFDLAMASQIDLGGRYAINQNWSLDFGWRVLALSGVAISEDNVAQGNFQNVDAVAEIQTAGSLILHGGYAGLTYAW